MHYIASPCIAITYAKHTVGKFKVNDLCHFSHSSVERLMRMHELSVHVALHKWHVLKYGHLLRGPF